MAVFVRGDFFCGYIQHGDRLYVYEVQYENNSSSDKYKFKIDWRLKVLLQNSLREFLSNCKFRSPQEFHSQLSNLVGTQKLPNQNSLKACSLLKSLMQELANCEKFIKNLDLETGLVEIDVPDLQLRVHKASFKLSQNYPREPIEVVCHDLPLLSFDLTASNSDLSNLHSVTEFCNKFSLLVETFQEFWKLMSIIDSSTIVLDPANPTYKNIMRRIKLSDTLSAALIFNPYNPKHKPKIKLLGCQSDVEKHEAIMLRNLDNVWDADGDFLYNLSNVLEINIPNKIYLNENVDAISKNVEGACAICFMWRLDDEIPSEVCERSTCKSIYHNKCLFTYLISVPRNKNYFGKIQGECLNCDDVIFCTVPKPE